MNENIVARFRTKEEAEACRDYFHLRPSTLLMIEEADGEARLVLNSNHFSNAEAAQLSLQADAFRGGLDAWHTIYRSKKNPEDAGLPPSGADRVADLQRIRTHKGPVDPDV